MRHHPAARALAAWFDGEDTPAVAHHIGGCERCRRHVLELRRVRAAVRGEPIPAPMSAPVRGWRPVLAPAALVLVLVVVLIGTTIPGAVRTPLRTARDLLDGHAEPDQAATPATTATTAPRPQSSPTPRLMPTPPTTGSDAPESSVAASAAAPVLRLAVVVPTAGPLAADGTDTVTAVRRVVDAANQAGGVGGRAVEMVVVDADDAGAIAQLTGSASVVVGGFGALPPVPWLFPAEPHARGSLAVEVPAAEVGALLAADLARRGIEGTVAAVVGDGPDGALADGVAQHMRLTRVAAASSRCESEVNAARRSRPAALMLAVAPDVARRCLDAAARLGWHPPGGVLLAPSAAYAGLERHPATAGGRTVLGLPWPTSNEPGAARFRAAVSGVVSYRALVAYAGAELAVASARVRSPLRLADLARGTWQTDLVTLSDGANTTARIVVAGAGGWATAAVASRTRE